MKKYAYLAFQVSTVACSKVRQTTDFYGVIEVGDPTEEGIPVTLRGSWPGYDFGPYNVTHLAKSVTITHPEWEYPYIQVEFVLGGTNRYYLNGNREQLLMEEKDQIQWFYLPKEERRKCIECPW